MGQEEVYNLLKKKNTWLTGTQIRMSLGVTLSTVNQNLRRLYKQGYVMRRNKRSRLYPYNEYEWRVYD